MNPGDKVEILRDRATVDGSSMWIAYILGILHGAALGAAIVLRYNF